MEFSRQLQLRDMVTVMTPEELRHYLNQRRIALSGDIKADLGRKMGIPPQHAVNFLSGERVFGKRQIERFNAIDPEFEILQLIGVARKSQQR